MSFPISASYREIILCCMLWSSHPLHFRAKAVSTESSGSLGQMKYVFESVQCYACMSLCLLVFCKALQRNWRYVTLGFGPSYQDQAPKWQALQHLTGRCLSLFWIWSKSFITLASSGTGKFYSGIKIYYFQKFSF